MYVGGHNSKKFRDIYLFFIYLNLSKFRLIAVFLRSLCLGFIIIWLILETKTDKNDNKIHELAKNCSVSCLNRQAKSRYNWFNGQRQKEEDKQDQFFY